MSSDTLVSLFYSQAEQLAGSPVALVKRDGRYGEVSWDSLSQSVTEIAAGLIARGVQTGDRVGLLSENRLEWIEADLGIMVAGAITVALYAPLTAAQVREQFADCAPVAAIVSTAEQRDKLLSVQELLPSIRHVIVCDSNAAFQDVISLAEFKSEGRSALEKDPKLVERRSASIGPEDLAAISYTSGTTGESKGVMLTHANLTSNVLSCQEHWPVEAGTIDLIFLPMNHIYARTCNVYFGLATGRILALAESVDTIVQNLQEVRPHYFSAVPRIHQKLMAATRPAFEAGDRDALKKLLGGRVEYVSSGGAALPPEIARYYWDAGVPVYQGYGLTETSPVITFSRPEANRIGAAGKALPGVEVRIADDGEILSRGPHIMKGYWGKPEATAEVIDSDGWFHTGDIGHLDEDGFLFITDRKKDILVTAYGKNVAPQQIECLLSTDPFIEQAMVYGDGKPCLTALVVPARGPLEMWARANGLANSAWEDLLEQEGVTGLYRERIDCALRDLAPHEQVRKFILLPEPFTAARGEMTVTAKLRRRSIADRYRDRLESLYEGS